MGGVDVYGNLLGSYRPPISGKKWYDPLFSNIYNTSVIASWGIQEKLRGNKTSQLNLCRKPRCLFKSIRVFPQTRHTHAMPSEIRYDRMHRFRASITKRNAKFATKVFVCIKA